MSLFGANDTDLHAITMQGPATVLLQQLTGEVQEDLVVRLRDGTGAVVL
jgi:hypothetical protein